MHRKRIVKAFLFTALSILITVSLFGNAAQAITNGQPDGANHPMVGLVVFEDIPGHPAWRATGILLSPTILLTAGHATDGAVKARVWFSPGPIAGSYPYAGPGAYEGIPYTMPGFGYYLTNAGLPGFITHDVGIVVLSQPVPTSVVSEYGILPTTGIVNTLKPMTYVDLVGYGVQYQVTPRNDGGPYEAWRGARTRYYATAQLISGKFDFSNEFIRTSQNPAQGKGGTAFGDSGGPVFQADTTTILGTTSFGSNSNCAGTGYYYRTDQPDVLEFINSFLT